MKEDGRKNRFKWMKQIVLVCLVCTLCAGFLPVKAANLQGQEENQDAVSHTKENLSSNQNVEKTSEESMAVNQSENQDAETKNITDYKEISNLVANTWQEDYFGKITISPDSKKIKKDGETKSFAREFGVKSAEVKDVISSKDAVEDFLAGQDAEMIYEVEENENGDFDVTAPYQTKRLLVDTISLSEDYGAETVYYNEEDQETILQFASQEETREACEKIEKQYGEGYCYPDEIYYIEDLLMGDRLSENNTAFSEETLSEGSALSVYNSNSWGMSYMGMDVVKEQTAATPYTGTVTVAVIDSGINTSNMMFQGRTISPDSYSFIDNNTNINDSYGHGTHVCGIIADATPANVQILMIKTTNNDGETSTLTLKTAMQYAVKKKADVINMSLGFMGIDVSQITFLDTIITKAKNKGIPICAASGNGFNNNGIGVDVKYCYPACNKTTIAVSALNPDGNIAAYSGRGTLIDFAAPGTAIVSADAKTSKGTVEMSGTSMASPHIAAAMAYIKLMQSNLSVNGVYAELKLYCKDLGASGRDIYYGWGCPVLSSLYTRGITYSENIVTNGVEIPKLKSVKNTEGGIEVSWKKVSGVSGYRIYRKQGNSSYKKIGSVSSKKNIFTDKKAVQGRTYSYVVRAYKSGKTSNISQEKTVIRLKTVVRIQAKNTKGKKVLVSWQKTKQVSGYQIQYAKNKKFKNAKTVPLSQNAGRRNLSGLNRGTYYIRVRAIKTTTTVSGSSSWSDSCKIRVK